ncbi:MAG: hypothetical protein OXS35_00745 [Dehalococcoidia bacterium]|nr:hypothetical protein [Dehalococcoidia bacterium]
MLGVANEDQGIALALALGGFKVVLVDSSRDKLRREVDDVSNALMRSAALNSRERWID